MERLYNTRSRNKLNQNRESLTSKASAKRIKSNKEWHKLTTSTLNTPIFDPNHTPKTAPSETNNFNNIVEKTPVDENHLAMFSRLPAKFFNTTTEELAKNLLGKILVRSVNGNVLKCRIVETESYPGKDDKGSATYNYRRTQAVEPLYGKPGTAFVYMTYGMYHCFNISSADEGGGVLIRAGEPLYGTEIMTNNRESKLKSKKSIKLEEICRGPSKLCMAMEIDKKTCNTLDLCDSDAMWIESDEFQSVDIVFSKRIGIDRTGPEAVNKLYRYYLLRNNYVSKRDKSAEDSKLNIK